jgi:hypothetical protein
LSDTENLKAGNQASGKPEDTEVTGGIQFNDL